MSLSEAKRKFIELEKKKEEYKKYLEDYKAAVQAVVDESGKDCYFMDDQGTVYGIVEPEGRFIYYEKYSCVRTKRPGEARGTLSIKEAQERGFNVK